MPLWHWEKDPEHPKLRRTGECSRSKPIWLSKMKQRHGEITEHRVTPKKWNIYTFADGTVATVEGYAGTC